MPASARWRELLRANGPKIATWVLALLLAIQAALLVTDLAAGAKPARAAAVSEPTVAVAPKPHANLALITSAHLFGVNAAGATAVDATNAPKTNLALVLTGVIAGDDPSTGLAIVGESANAAKVYGTGDALPGGAKLHAVYSDRVLLERNGAIESLVLPHEFAGNAAGDAPLPSASEDSTPMERVRRVISEQPGAISEIMRPQPVFAQGKQRGYRIYPGRNRQAFVRLGLRPGDLVTSINGTPLDDPSRGQEIFQTLGAASEARVTVMRNGQQQDLTLNMSQVAQQAEALQPPPQTEESEPEQAAPEDSATPPEDQD